MSTRDDHKALSPEAEALIDNGLGFLEKARKELEGGEARYAVVSFWTAVEILLKMPLLQEHWTLVCTGKKITRKDYLSGDFQSITYSETLERLEKIPEIPISKETSAIFDRVRRHRNRVVHFYHEGFDSDANELILAEQADAWFALNRLLRGEWRRHFNGRLSVRLQLNENHLLSGHRYYARVKMRHITERLSVMRGQGSEFTRCFRCKQAAMSEETAGHAGRHTLITRLCQVCLFRSSYVLVICPGCGVSVSMKKGEGEFHCSSCDRKENRYALLDDVSGRPQDYQPSLYPAGCQRCATANTVCQFGEGNLCTECYTLNGPLQRCEHCGHANNRVTEFSAEIGCTACWGSEGWESFADGLI